MMETNLNRIRDTIEKLAEFNVTPGKGCTRFSYSKEDQAARSYLVEKFQDLGLKVNIDAVGNIRARLEGMDPDGPVVLTGSHIDTVLNGGKFDGVVGVVAALEMVTVIVEAGKKTKNPIEIIVFVEEEGSNFGSTMAGSKALVGKYKIEDIKRLKNDKGTSMFEVARDFGLKPESLDEYVIKPGEIKAMVEMHVEQSVVLETEGVAIGIVDAIAGGKWFKVEFEGVGNHAGATPMFLRRDPMVAASKTICELERIVLEKALPTTVGTVGKINCEPNVSNCIAQKVTFTFDIRDVDNRGIDMVITEIKKTILEIAESLKLKASIELIGESEPIKLSDHVIKIIEQVAEKMEVKYKRMNSGAVHDAAMLANVTDVGMIFVPSINGRSHVPDELTDYKDIKTGSDILLQTILQLAD